MSEAVRVTPSGAYYWDFTEQEKLTSTSTPNVPVMDYASAKRNAYSDVVDEVLNLTTKWQPDPKGPTSTQATVKQETQVSSAPVTTPMPPPTPNTTGF